MIKREEKSVGRQDWAADMTRAFAQGYVEDMDNFTFLRQEQEEWRLAGISLPRGQKLEKSKCC